MGKEQETISAARWTAALACVEHARRLLRGANAVLASDVPNVAFHLAILALEELGRRELILLQQMTDRRPVPPAWVRSISRITLENCSGVFSERRPSRMC